MPSIIIEGRTFDTATATDTEFMLVMLYLQNLKIISLLSKSMRMRRW